MGIDTSRNVVLGYPNLADAATLSGGNWSATLPLARVQNKVIRELARTADASNSATQFKIAYAEAKTFKMIALCNHNFSIAAQYRIRQYTDAGFTTLVADTGVLDVWEAIYSTLSMSWRDYHWWSGKPVLADIAGYRWSLLHLFDEDQTAQYIKVELFDTTNADGYLQFGRLFVSPIFQPLFNMSYGASVRYASNTTVQVNKRSGQAFFDKTEGHRIAQLKFDYLAPYEAMQRLDAQRILDVDGEVFFIWDPQDLVNLQRLSFIGRQAELNPIEHPYFSNHSEAIEIQEIL